MPTALRTFLVWNLRLVVRIMIRTNTNTVRSGLVTPSRRLWLLLRSSIQIIDPMRDAQAIPTVLSSDQVVSGNLTLED